MDNDFFNSIDPLRKLVLHRSSATGSAQRCISPPRVEGDGASLPNFAFEMRHEYATYLATRAVSKRDGHVPGTGNVGARKAHDEICNWQTLSPAVPSLTTSALQT